LLEKIGAALATVTVRFVEVVAIPLFAVFGGGAQREACWILRVWNLDWNGPCFSERRNRAPQPQRRRGHHAGEAAMLKGLIGRTTTVGTLKDGLDASVERTRVTAHRVANASVPGGGLGGNFASVLAAAGGEDVDLEVEMVALADEQLRFDATAVLLQKLYGQIRSSVRER
jgi:hypothetical protein